MTTTHNAGKIKWNSITDNVSYDYKTRKFVIDNYKCFRFIGINIFNTIDDFSKTIKFVGGKKSKNPIISKYNENDFNAINWIDKSDFGPFDPKYVHYKALIGGWTPWVGGYIPLMIKAYVFFNLILLDYEYYYLLRYFPEQYIRKCDSNFPKFFIDEYNKVHDLVLPIIKYKENPEHYELIPRLKLNKDELQQIRNFCGFVFKIIYTTYANYKFDSKFVSEKVLVLFRELYHILLDEDLNLSFFDTKSFNKHKKING